MDALIPAFVAVLLAETGGRLQSRVVALGQGGVSSGRLLLMVAVSSLLLHGLSAMAGYWIGQMLTPNPRWLLLGLALLFAGAPMLLPLRRQAAAGGGTLKSFAGIFAAQLGDASTFIVFALAALLQTPLLAAAGGIIGALVAGVVPALAGQELPRLAPMQGLRWASATLLIAASAWLLVGTISTI